MSVVIVAIKTARMLAKLKSHWHRVESKNLAVLRIPILVSLVKCVIGVSDSPLQC